MIKHRGFKYLIILCLILILLPLFYSNEEISLIIIGYPDNLFQKIFSIAITLFGIMYIYDRLNELYLMKDYIIIRNKSIYFKICILKLIQSVFIYYMLLILMLLIFNGLSYLIFIYALIYLILFILQIILNDKTFNIIYIFFVFIILKILLL